MADNIGTAYVLIEPTAKGISGKIEKELGGAGESGGHSFAKGFGKVVAGGLVASTAAVTGFAKASISAGSNFDASMSQVAATMGTTVDKIQNLRDFAQEMGSTTAFSATEAADALNYMALAGYDADTSMKMLPNVLNLAAAGGIDLASASDMVTDAQTALGLSIDETSTMVDQMAKASSKSNTSVQQLGEAFLTIGANARNVKGGTQELSTVLGVLADNGIKGTEAGTHLRNIMLAMNPTTDKAAAAWEQLGVSAYDADGNMRELPEVFGELSEAMKDMSEQEKTDMLSAMFNKTDLASIQALIGTTSERYDELSKSIGNAKGAAGEMAETQLDNLAGSVTLFKSALEGAEIAVSDQLTPTLKDFVDFGANGLGTLTQAFNEGGLDGAMTALGTLLSDGLKMLIDKIPAVIEAGGKLLMALVQGIITNLPAILQTALQIIIELARGIVEAIPTLIPAITQVIIDIATMLTEPDTLVQLIMCAADLMVALAEGLVEAVPQLIEVLPTIIANLIAALIELAPQLITAAAKLVLTLAEGIVKSVGSLAKAVVDLWNKIKEVWQTKIGDVKTWGRDMIDQFIGGIKEKWESFNETLSNLAGTVKDFLGFSVPEKGPLHEWATNNPGYDMVELFTEGMNDAAPDLEAELSQNVALPMLDMMNASMSSSVNSGMNEQAPTPIIVRLEGDAQKFFSYIQSQNDIYKRMNGGTSAFA